MASTPHCVALDNLADRESVLIASEVGDLPPVVRIHSTKAGEWVEFDTHTQPSRSLRPVIWFHFYTKQESDAAQERLQNCPQGEGSCSVHSGDELEGSEEEGLAEDVAEALFQGPQLGDAEARKTTGRDR